MSRLVVFASELLLVSSGAKKGAAPLGLPVLLVVFHLEFAFDVAGLVVEG